MRRLIFLVFLVISSACYAQDNNGDSLRRVLNLHIRMDTVRVTMLNNYAAAIRASDAEEALKILNAAENLANTLNYDKGKLNAYLQLGKFYNENKNYNKALAYAAKGTALARKLGLHDEKRAFFLLTSEIHYNRDSDTIIAKDFVAEIKYKAFLRDSLKKAQNNASSFETVVKEQHDELSANRFIIFLGIVAFILALLLAAFVSARVKARKATMEKKQLLTEQKLRRSQMNPHFIFNSIQNVRSLINNNQEAEAIEYINTFSALTRQILESSDENYTSLAEEVELITNYITLQQLLYKNPFSYTIWVDDSIDQESLFLPPMLSQPFIENAIKHGLANKSENGELKIRFYMKSHKLIFEVIDNGGGFGNSKKDEKHKSMAMDITRNRLAHYSKKSYFTVQADNILDGQKNILGARVSFEVPYIYEY